MKFLVLFFLFTVNILSAQNWSDSVQKVRIQHTQELLDTTSGILSAQEIMEFYGTDYFPIDSTFRIKARFELSKGKRFKMPTTTDRKPIYRRFGFVYFELGGKECRLTVYQNVALSKQAEFKNYLFIPFKDQTCGTHSYGGGRYLDLVIPNEEYILLDFNLVYNPYCAYSHRYSCPIPPEENTLSIPVNAGEKLPLGQN